MTVNVNRRSFFSVAGLAGLALLSGCTSGGSASASSSQESSANDSSDGQVMDGDGMFREKLIIGTLATEDILPLWAAQKEGLFDGKGFGIEIVPFQSATELIAGVASGEVNMAMTDIMVTASMFASGVDVQMKWVTLGATPDQGRFGIMAGPESEIKTLADLAGVPIGVGSNTILEYVMDKLMEGAGVSDDKIVVEELQKLPVRYQAMASGEVAAAALPGTLLALGEASGCKLIADDTQGDNLSQSVMIVSRGLLGELEGSKAVAALEGIWNDAAEMVNADPESYREVLIDNANLPVEIADTYPISTYPMVALPTAAMVDPVLEWMEKKGYLTKPLAYDETTGEFSKK
ncbi:MAG: ABC transporter substrate-binding protein [Eggerthellaceae bacterium]|nr:ABC transporter substrate-binding protein [Eggerthellaceae bacterium]